MSATVSVADLIAVALSNKAVKHNQALLAKIQAAQINQARAWDNPSLTLRGGRFTPKDTAEEKATTWEIELSQRVELPWKRSAKIRAAQAGAALSQAESDLERVERIASLRQAALAFEGAKLALQQARDSLSIAKQIRESVEKRKNAGEASSADVSLAKLEEGMADLALSAQHNEYAQALETLRFSCGGVTLPDAFCISDALPTEFPKAHLETVLTQAKSTHPALRAAQAQIEQAQAELTSQRHAWQPDLTVGVSKIQESDGSSIAVSLGIDLPLWNWNGSGIQAADADAGRKLLAGTIALRRQNMEITNAWNAYESARSQSASLAHSLVSLAKDNLRLRLIAYAAGDESISAVLEARRSLVNVEENFREARKTAAAAAIELGRTSGVFPTQTPESKLP
jgi:cobalt-zinc-cadmium efflux system outer membrane protein